jgi:peptidoglycan/LPS O-acetylase OafA/YrhL
MAAAAPTKLATSQGRDAATAPLDGMRALLNMWIMWFHSLFMMMTFMTEAEAKALYGTGFLSVGYLAVDGFFLLTGFLLVVPLLRRPQPAGVGLADTLRGYYHQRFLRIMLPGGAPRRLLPA